MQAKYYYTLALWLVALSLHAQVTLTSDNFRNPVGDTLKRVNISFATFPASYFLPPSEGANQQWDYRWLEQINGYSDPHPEITDPAYPDANTFITDLKRPNLSTTFYPLPVRLYQRYDDTGWTTVGETLADPVPLPFFCEGCDSDTVRYESVGISPATPLTNLKLPLNFGDNWTDTYVRQTDAQLLLPTLGLDDVPAQVTDSVERSSAVVGWGTLTLPNNSLSGFIDLDVLLLRETTSRTSYYTVDGAPAPTNLLDSLGVVQGQTVTIHHYYFYTPGLGQPAFSVAFTSTGEPYATRMAASLARVNPATEGSFTTVPITHDGMDRSYDHFVPASYTGDEPVPLMVVLHGYTGNAKLTAWQSRMNEVADTAGFIVVYPQGGLVTQPIPIPGLPQQSFGWNVPGVIANTDDIGYLRSVVESLSNTYNIDEEAIYLSGISMGAAMADVMSNAAPDRFAGIGIVANSSIVPRTHLIPTMIVRGTDDPLVPYDGFPQLGIPSTREAVAYYAQLNGCALVPDSVNLEDKDPNDGTTVTRFTYTDCYGNADLVFYRVNGGSHVWDDGPPAPLFFQPVIGPNVNRDFSVSATLWNFFKTHRLPHARLLPQTLEDQDSMRNYLLYLPAAYDGSEEWPLVLNLHGASNNSYAQMWGSRMNLVADTAQFLVAYPEGHSLGTGRVWNTEERPELPDDITFLSRLIDTLTTDYAIDPARIYSTGFSMGGEMSYLLACNIPDEMAAIASVSGPTLTSNDWTCTANRPLPLLHMHGTADTIAPIDGGVRGSTGQSFPPVRDQLEFWLNSNGCSPDSTVIELPDIFPDDNSTVTLTRFETCDLYQGTDGNSRLAEVWYYQVEGGGHSWPDGRFDFFPSEVQPSLLAINRDINASSEIWNFFNRHQLVTRTSSVLAETYQLKTFPNPTQDYFQLSFELPTAAQVQVKLFNTVGQLVYQRQAGRLPAGPQNLRVEQAAALPAGMYYYRLQINNQQISGPVVIQHAP